MSSSVEKFIFGIIGNRLKVDDNNSRATIRWKRMSGVEVGLVFLTIMGAIYGMASALKWETVMGLEVVPFSDGFKCGYWSVLSVFAAHLLFNRLSKMHINKRKVTFQRRAFLSKKYTFTTDQIIQIELKMQNESYTDSNFTPDLYTVYVYITGSGKLRLDEFNGQDAQLIKKTLEKYTTATA